MPLAKFAQQPADHLPTRFGCEGVQGLSGLSLFDGQLVATESCDFTGQCCWHGCYE